MDRPYFCNLPFTAIYSSNGVDAAPCCVFKNQGPVHLKDYQTNPEIRSVKEQLLKGEAPRQCDNCYHNESRGLPSFRQQTKFHPDRDAEIFEKNDPDFFNLKEASVLTSNRCNLKCTSCGDASYIRSMELKKMGLQSHVAEKIITRSFDILLEHDIEQLTLLGGEPFVDKIAFDLIDSLIESGKSKRMRIDLNTNMTVMSDQQLDMLSENFKEVVIKASIDGIGEVNDYLRYPSLWSTIENNCQRVRQRSNMSLIVTTALSNLSLLRYHEVIRWAHQENLSLFISTVTHPSVMDTNLLPQQLKVQLLDIYQSMKNEMYDKLSDRNQECLDRCIEICKNKSDLDLPSFSESIDFFKRHDSVRKDQSLEKVFPELEFYLFEYDRLQ